MSKERLEEIKEQVKYLQGDLMRDDLGWLIEQAERVQELECLEMQARMEKHKYKKQNKRYREALEFYAEDDNYGYEVSYRPQPEIDCMVLDDRGYTARQALEGENE